MSFLNTLKGLTLPNKIVLALAMLAVIGLMTVLTQNALKPRMALLYSGLDASSAGDMVAELEKSGVKYDIRGEAIFVAEKDRDKARLGLARLGLPRQSVKGYELLDDVNGFSVTSEMYNTSYWRAKEGELMRTILSVQGVVAARVHIGAQLKTGFGRNQQPQSASVTISTTRRMPPGQAEAIQYLVALSIAGLTPDEVAVIDTSYGILVGPGKDNNEQVDVASQTFSDRLEKKIIELLEARLGVGNAKVSVSVDLNRSREVTSAVMIDPRSKVVLSRSTNEESESNSGSTGGLTIASNLPESENGSAGTSSQSRNNASESVKYDFSQTRTEIEKLPGKVEKISIAVLVNEAMLIDQAEDEGGISGVELEALEKLVASAAGLNIERGDSLTLEAMPFNIVPETELAPAAPFIQTYLEKYLWSGIQALILGIVVIILGLAVIKPILLQPSRMLENEETGNENDELTTQVNDPVIYLKDVARTQQAETAAILKEWLSEDKKVAAR